MELTNLNQKNFNKEVNSEQLVVLDFWAPWCGPCKMMEPVFLKTAKIYEGRVKFAKVNTQEQMAVADRFSVQAIPTIVFMKKGTESFRHIGYLSEEELKKKTDLLLQK